MKTNNKGFTLIELIMVIVSLGILAAVAVPKFFGFTQDAHEASIEAFVGAFKTGLLTYHANQLINGSDTYYDADGFTSADPGDFSAILEDSDDNWKIVDSAEDDNDCEFQYTGGGDATTEKYWVYTCSGGDSYTLVGYTSSQE